MERGDLVEVKDPDGSGWILAKFGEVAPTQPKHIDHPGVNEGRGYDITQAWVIYQEGERAGTAGLHPVREIRPRD